MLVADLTRDLSQARAEREAWRVVAVQSIHYLHERFVEYKRLEDRYHRFLREQRGIDREAVEHAEAEEQAGEAACAFL